ncbi:MAG: CPBP family intramembrane metalloprotease [Parachlamydiales bacterium]|nr:CPBP family intramembrane metalloprotease [Parachlamydiales bacterium]
MATDSWMLDHAKLVFFAFMASVVASLIARTLGFFQTYSKNNVSVIRGIHVIGAFIVFFGIGYLIRLLLSLLVTRPQDFTIVLGAKYQIIALVSLLFFLILFAFAIKKLRPIFWDEGPATFDRFFKCILTGCLTWLIAFPVSLLIGQILTIISYFIFGKSETSQVAVEQIRALMPYPVLYAILAVCLVTVVPMLEEMLFRGFVQNWLTEKMGWTAGWILTSLCFALFHFSFIQSYGNIEIIGSLFVLALFLGYIYKKTQCLWTNVALHGFYNGMTILFLTFSKAT